MAGPAILTGTPVHTASSTTGLQLGDRTAGGRDLVARAAREGVRADRQGDLAEVAVTQHLDRLAGPDCANRGQLLGTHGAAGREQPRQIADVHDLVLHPEAVAEALEL